MPGDVSIRFVTRQDYSKWLPLWDGYNAFYERTGPTALDPAITAMTWARFFDAYEPVHAIVAERDGELLGLVHYLFHRRPPRSNRPSICRISSPAQPRAARALAAR